MKLSENAITILKKRYLSEGETPEMMFRRVAKHVSNGDGYEEDYYYMMTRLEFLPNSPTLMNAGKPLGQLSACFVLPIEDSMDSIFETIKSTALIHKSGGGTGFNFSKIRPKGSAVSSTGGVASGPISFMKVFNAATEAVKQGGKRRGANMGILNCDHPDIREFITCKDDNSELTNFNLSVAVTDSFMDAVINGNKHETEIFNLMVEQAWKNGEPGIIFIDEVNRYTDEWIDATNPCGEQPLLPYESCNLGSINLSAFVTDSMQIKFSRLYEVVRLAVKFLNGVIDVNNYPFIGIAIATKKTRKIGLGVMGWADMLYKLDIPYNSDIALHYVDVIMECIKTIAEIESEKIGGNKTLLTIAPTGTLSLIADCSSGIEPVFAVEFERSQADEKMTQKSKYTKPVLTAHDLTVEEHVKMQAAFQKHVDNAVSKTINLRHDATVHDVAKAYILAYQLKCKGVTVYRDGSRAGQTLSTNNTNAPKQVDIKGRPQVLNGFTTKQKIGCGNLYVTVNSDDKGCSEVFTNTGRTGGCPSQSEATARLVSLALRAGIPSVDIINQLKGIRCPSTLKLEGNTCLSCPDAIGRALEGTSGVKPIPKQGCAECGHDIRFEGGCSVCPKCGNSKCG